ncbi:MAG TPA: carboxypeptidase-like regulatory domain-containing protein, partial [Candidatus Sumerlaeota bacterium]|nr:carboxypeptidase-like regulatory domain-containing protein [Candidatus Sumerlaeota bacterium]
MSRHRKFLVGSVVAFFTGLVFYLLSSNSDGEKNVPIDSAPSVVIPTRQLTHEDGVSSPTQPSVLPVAEKNASQSFPVLVTWRNSDEPVEGMSVTLSPLSPSKTVKEKIQPVTGLTDKAGQATISFPPDILLPRDLHCQVQVDGPGAAPLLIEKARVYTTQTLELTVDKAYDLYGTVYWNPKGTGNVPAPGAQISFVGASNGYKLEFSNDSRKIMDTTTADAQGHYEVRSFPDSPVRIWARLGEFVTVDSPVMVMPRHGNRNGPFDLYLQPGLTLVVLVSDKATLQPIPNASVGTEFGGGLSLSGTTNAEGFCNLVGVPTGLLLSFAQAEGYSRETLSVEATREGDNMVAFYLDKGGRARIQTIDYETKAPVGNVSFFWVAPYRNAANSIQSDAQGIALVDGIPIGARVYLCPSTEGKHVLPKIPVVGGREGETKEKEVFFVAEEGKTEDVTLEVTPKPLNSSKHNESLRERHTVEGEVVDIDGKPVQNALVTASSACCMAQTATDASGLFRLENVCVEI